MENSVTPSCFHHSSDATRRSRFCVKSPMSVIRSRRSISKHRSNCNDLNPPSARKTVAWRMNGGGERGRRKKTSKQIFIPRGNRRRKKVGRGDMSAFRKAGRHVSRAVISFFMADYAGYPSLIQRERRPRNIWPGDLIYTGIKMSLLPLSPLPSRAT